MAAPRQMVQHTVCSCPRAGVKAIPSVDVEQQFTECTRMRVRCVRVTSRFKRVDDSDDVE